MFKGVVYVLPFFVSLVSNANYHNTAFVSLYTGFDFNAKIQSTNAIDNKVYDDEYKVSPLIGGVAGYDYNDLSFYVSYDRRSFKSEPDPTYGNKLNVNIALANIAYNFHVINPSFVPYISLGIGMAQAHIQYNNVVTLINGNTGTKQDIENAFVYQVKGGARLFLTQHLAVFTDARFASMQSTDYTKNQLFVSGSTVRMQFFSVNGGLSYFF